MPDPAAEPLPLLLVPGLLCDETVWAAQRAALSPTRAVGVPVLWGLDSIPAMAASALAAAPPRFALAGHSLGARVALEMVRQAPARVARLALLDTGTQPRRPGEAEARAELVQLAEREGMAALAARWLPPMLHPARAGDAALLGPLTAMVCRATPAIFAAQVRALLDRPDAAAVLPGLRCPTLVGCGRQDGWSPLSQHEAIVAALPGARLVVFEESGHMSPVEAPEAVTAALRDWLEEATP